MRIARSIPVSAVAMCSARWWILRWTVGPDGNVVMMPVAASGRIRLMSQTRRRRRSVTDQWQGETGENCSCGVFHGVGDQGGEVVVEDCGGVDGGGEFGG
ncbi:hypothetical protein [Corynebacterium provencense]|uniref:hypothetical protein n=1 Tax=Corynebacterium provencense TaxID=1737425 RepID=UPI0011C9E8E7|nr:hypothetical protein [Corynebacterium provencense]